MLGLGPGALLLVRQPLCAPVVLARPSSALAGVPGVLGPGGRGPHQVAVRLVAASPAWTVCKCLCLIPLYNTRCAEKSVG